MVWFCYKDTAVWQSQSADGLGQQEASDPNERWQVSALCQGSAAQLFGGGDVHCPPAPEAVWGVQVRANLFLIKGF